MKAHWKFAVFLWATVLVVQVGSWSSAHAVPLQGGNIRLTLPAAPAWRAVHVLVDGCACSRAVFDHLKRRGPQPGWHEMIWVLGGAAPEEIPGFPVTALNEQAIQDAGLVGGPRLIIFSPSGKMVWSGGYSKQRPHRNNEMLDLSAMGSVLLGQTPSEIPVFGCPRLTSIRKAYS